MICRFAGVLTMWFRLVVNCGREPVWRECGPRMQPATSYSGKYVHTTFQRTYCTICTYLANSCERAGNVEALIKSAIAHLYSESRSAAGRDDAAHGLCSEKAAQLFIATEESHVHRPFTWLLYRSPWAPGGSCCKAAVFRHVQALCDRDQDVKATSNMLYCVAKALSFNEVGLSACLNVVYSSIQVYCTDSSLSAGCITLSALS